MANVPKKYREHIQFYLERAKGKHIGNLAWTTQWRNLHGEGRTSSAGGVFRIKIKKTSANPPAYRSIIVSTKGGIYIKETEIEFTEEPDPRHILNEYKRMFDVEVTTPTDSGSEE